MRPRLLLIAAVVLGISMAVFVRSSSHQSPATVGTVVSTTSLVASTSSTAPTTSLATTTVPVASTTTISQVTTSETLVGANQETPVEATLPTTTPPSPEGSGGVSGQTAMSAASQFAVAYYSYRFDDVPGAWLAALTPLATPAYGQVLAGQQPSEQLLSDRQQRSEQSSVFVLKATESAPGSSPYLVTLEVQVEVSGAAGSSGSRFAIQLGLQQSGTVWLVDSLESVAGA